MAKMPTVTPKRDNTVRNKLTFSALRANRKLSNMSRKVSINTLKTYGLNLGYIKALIKTNHYFCNLDLKCPYYGLDIKV